MRCAIRGVLLAGAMLVSVASQAYVVPVTNASFETTSNAALSSDVDGQWWSGFHPGWTGSGSTGTWIPYASVFTDSIPDGTQVAYMNGGGSIWQSTGELIQAGYTYTLSVMVGTRETNQTSAVTFDGARISLLGDGNTLDSATLTTLAVGKWAQLATSFTATAGDAGKTLQIRLEGLKQGVQTNYDAVSVTAVPLPAAAWLFGSALLGLGLVRRRAVGGVVAA